MTSRARLALVPSRALSEEMVGMQTNNLTELCDCIQAVNGCREPANHQAASGSQEKQTSRAAACPNGLQCKTAVPCGRTTPWHRLRDNVPLVC